MQNREDNEAYATRIEGQHYAVYFPKRGEVALDLSDAKGNFELKWLDVTASRWGATSTVSGEQIVTLRAPNEGHQVALFNAISE